MEDTVRCDYAMNCSTGASAIDMPKPMRDVLQRNEITKVGDSPLMAHVPERIYPGEKPNLILGRYMTHLPRGRGLLDGAAIAADFSTKAI